MCRARKARRGNNARGLFGLIAVRFQSERASPRNVNDHTHTHAARYTGNTSRNAQNHPVGRNTRVHLNSADSAARTREYALACYGKMRLSGVIETVR